MFQRFIPVAAVAVLLLLVGTIWYQQLHRGLPPIMPTAPALSDPSIPDFSIYVEVADKKAAFFNFVLPFEHAENERIEELRATLSAIKQQVEAAGGGSEIFGEGSDTYLDTHEQHWLEDMAEIYRVEMGEGKQQFTLMAVLDALLLKVDVVPTSLALAQAANESGWGTSRFALEGNNLFGQWCFSEGCGLVPGNRSSSAKHEVATFDSPRQSVESYILNINRHYAYDDLREIRAGQREEEGVLTGLDLTEGLINYSTRGEEYIHELERMIKTNKLVQFDSDSYGSG